jgi:CheY-like chemotaxis protein
MSRPRKLILLVDSCEQTLSETRMVLETHLYRVIAATCSMEALEAFKATEGIDLVLLNDNPHVVDSAWLLPRMKRARLFVPIAVLVDKAENCPPEGVPIFPGSTSDLLERIKTLSARKRGPRPASSYRPKQVTSAGAQKGAT